jgi:ribonuclease J
MTSLTFYGGVGEIGGNKILLRDGDTSIFLDFGKNFERERRFYDEPYLSPREEKHLIYLGILPKISGLYKNDKAEPSIDAIVLSHPHADHWDYIRYVKDSVPIFCGETTKTMIVARELASAGQRADYRIASLSPIQGEQVCKKFHTFRTGDVLNIGTIRLEPIHVDHSVPGAYGFIIHTSNGIIAYTGDFRLHGPRADMSKEFIDKAKQVHPDVLLTEATNIVDAKMISESEVEEKITGIVSTTQGLTLAGFYLNDIDRLTTFWQAAKTNGRQLTMSTKQAWLVHNLRGDKHLNLFGLDDPNIRIFQREKKRQYEWEKALEQHYPGKVVKAGYVNTHQGELLLAASFLDMNEMVEVQPRPGSVYILSQSEPFNEEMEIDYNKLHNWLEICGLPLYQVHASGHINPDQLKWAINEINPRRLYPIHTDRPNLLAAYIRDLETEVVCPEEGVEYKLWLGKKDSNLP